MFKSTNQIGFVAKTSLQEQCLSGSDSAAIATDSHYPSHFYTFSP